MVRKSVLIFLFLLIAGLVFALTVNDGGDKNNMVFVTGGQFRMGDAGEPNDEEPVHPITLKNFYIGIYEVTQKEWIAVMGANLAYYIGDDNPVERVNWYEAVEFCNRKSIKEGRKPCYSGSGDDITCDFSADGYRLPTEAEWEFAALGGKKSKNFIYSGSNDAREVAWFEVNSGLRPNPVGQKKSNELGIYDMSGNIWEWCWDWYDKDYYKNSPGQDPTGPGPSKEQGKVRCYRGGGNCGREEFLRVKGRFSLPAGFKHSDMGVRLVCVDTGKKPEGMVLVEGGAFNMGDSYGGRQGERPVRLTTLSDFYLCKFEVTQQEWTDIMGDNPSFFMDLAAPVHCVSWNSAIDFCNKKSTAEGLTPCYKVSGNSVVCDFRADGYRLPTEAEWEYACRGGEKSKNFKFSGSNDPNEVAWFFPPSSYRMQPVGSKKPNELGIFDMSGNALEWCWDWFHREYYAGGDIADPIGPDSGVRRIVRGGSSLSTADTVRPFIRGSYKPFRAFLQIGLRVARTAVKK